MSLTVDNTVTKRDCYELPHKAANGSASLSFSLGLFVPKILHYVTSVVLLVEVRKTLPQHLKILIVAADSVKTLFDFCMMHC